MTIVKPLDWHRKRAGLYYARGGGGRVYWLEKFAPGGYVGTYWIGTVKTPKGQFTSRRIVKTYLKAEAAAACAFNNWLEIQVEQRQARERASAKPKGE